MKKKIKALWIAALTNGEYKQAIQRLRIGEESSPDKLAYCCLGVLCDLYRRETGRGQWVGNVFETLDDGKVDNFDPPLKVQEWAGLDELDLEMLVVHNDPQQFADAEEMAPSHSFTEISELINYYL